MRVVRVTLVLLVLPFYSFAMGNDSIRKYNANSFAISYGFTNPGKKLLRDDYYSQLQQLSRYGVQNISSFGYTVTGLGPVSVKVEHRFNSRLGLGPVVSFSKALLRTQYTAPTNTASGPFLLTNNTELNYYQLQTFNFGLRACFYLKSDRNGDIYCTTNIGYSHILETISDNFPDNAYFRPPIISNPFFFEEPEIITSIASPLYWGITFGVRQNLGKSMGVFIELGPDKWSLLQAGFFFRSY